jgi:hypothetical protein
MMALERSLVGVTNAVASQRSFLLETFSAENARIVFSHVNISAMFPQLILFLEFYAANAANLALFLISRLPLLCGCHKSGN